MASFVKVFNEHFVDFIKVITDTFPGDMEVITAKNSLLAIKKVNPKIISKIWKLYIADVYGEEIQKGDFNFFIEKNYKEDLEYVGNPDRIITAINRLREPIRKMDDETRAQTMKYMQNLSKLSLAISA